MAVAESQGVFWAFKKGGNSKNPEKTGIMYPTIHQSFQSLATIYKVIYKVFIETPMFVEALSH